MAMAAEKELGRCQAPGRGGEGHQGPYTPEEEAISISRLFTGDLTFAAVLLESRAVKPLYTSRGMNLVSLLLGSPLP